MGFVIELLCRREIDPLITGWLHAGRKKKTLFNYSPWLYFLALLDDGRIPEGAVWGWRKSDSQRSLAFRVNVDRLFSLFRFDSRAILGDFFFSLLKCLFLYWHVDWIMISSWCWSVYCFCVCWSVCFAFLCHY